MPCFVDTLGGLPLSEQDHRSGCRGRGEAEWGEQEERREGKLWLGCNINGKNLINKKKKKQAKQVSKKPLHGLYISNYFERLP